MFKPGSIRKIQVQNFVTYNYVELYPGPNLNMIIGPNGTGKSTIVAAIILGLGGSPKVVGRGNKVSEYVKHGCSCASINIYLQDDQENFIKVTREFDTQSKSQWKLNNARCLAEDVVNCIKRFNIQVDNLCQFLPQDRVQEFAKLNKQDLLKETQVALCRQDLLEKQNCLIAARKRHKELLSLSNSQTKKLQEAQDENTRLEGRVQNFKRKIKYKDMIKHIDRKIAWSLYEEVRAKLYEAKEDKIKALEAYELHKNELKPMQQEIDSCKQKIMDFKNANSKILQSIKNIEENVGAANDKVEILCSKVAEIENEMHNELAEVQQWDQQIEDTVKKLEEMKKLHDAAIARNKEEGLEGSYITNQIAQCSNRMASFQDKKEELEQNIRTSLAEMKALENEQVHIENVKQQRFEQLRRLNSDAYAAVLWLRNNKHLFSGEIFEPIMLEVNILDNSKAKYLEACIPLQDRLAFTCVEKEDMNMLIRCLRQEKKLSVNVVHSGIVGEKFLPNVPIERLRKFGFYTYVSTLFTAPEPIMRYLCRTYRLHDIPVGDVSTNACYERVPRGINLFFSDRHRYFISYSKYSGERSAKQDVIRGDGGLSLSLDVIRLENLKGRYNHVKRTIDGLKEQARAYDIQIAEFNKNIQILKEKLNESQRQKQRAQAIQIKIQGAEQHLNSMRKNKKSPEGIRTSSKVKVKKLAHAIGLLQESMKDDFEKLQAMFTQHGLNGLKIEAHRRKLDHLENVIIDSKRKLLELRDTLNAITDKYNAVMTEAKSQLARAKELSNGYTPADDGFEEFKQVYERLSNNIEELNSEKENLNSRISCLNTADDGEMKEYEDRISLIESLGRDVVETKSEINKITVTIGRIQEEWLSPLKDIAAGINMRFAASFERMGSAGEIDICTGDDEMDFEHYGLSIKVTYRRGEPLQELNSTIQSGGERAVATAAFMLALQELTPVPFRCVDEINQGMDANNERRIFELIVETTSQPNTSQYFLITPKLVPHLQYSEQSTVHIVHNGPFVNPDRKWGHSKFCNPCGVDIH
ncbi:structural maintenance of chromosomes protein 5 isoform X2 [Cylas formicarius]|uniref:structural maintenance of chromosomes protein 5 isoform X2 n=1 Tax=Cylas formicarius TaxID=197179 RepID=UPI002958D6DE|nr:structural maintenance of chromosomes protein 5 isoform X2 [Cylas formicarius]